MTRKKLLMLLGSVCLAVMMVVMACAGPAPSPTPSPSPSPTLTPSPTPPSVPTTEYTIRVAHQETTDDPIHHAWILFKDLMEARSNGEVAVEVYPLAELGSGRTNADQLAANEIEMANLYYTYLTGWLPWMSLADYPFAMPSDLEYTWRIYDSEIIPVTSEAISERGILMLGLIHAGPKVWLCKEPIRTPSDMEGKKCRSLATGVPAKALECWGAKPTVIPWGEAYTSFEMGTFDVMDCPGVAAVTFHYYDIADYIIKCDAASSGFAVSVSKEWFTSLPSDIRDLVEENVRVMQDYADCGRARMYAEVFEFFENSGRKVIYLTPEEKEAFKARLQPLYDWCVAEYGQDKVDLFLEH